MSNRLIIEGLADFKAQLRNLPTDLAGEAQRVVEATANGAAVTIRTVYGQHRVTGHLQDSVEVESRNTSGVGVRSVVRVKDPIAWLFDNGSQARHYITKGGARHDTGQMWGPAGGTHVFVRTMMKARTRMYDVDIRAILERAGLRVTGNA